MLILKLSPQAIKDLEDIFAFTLINWGIDQAEKYQDELYTIMETVSESPMIGSVYYFKGGNYRKINVNRHILFYTHNDKECVIMRVLHERMDFENLKF